MVSGVPLVNVSGQRLLQDCLQPHLRSGGAARWPDPSAPPSCAGAPTTSSDAEGLCVITSNLALHERKTGPQQSPVVHQSKCQSRREKGMRRMRESLNVGHGTEKVAIKDVLGRDGDAFLPAAASPTEPQAAVKGVAAI